MGDRAVLATSPNLDGTGLYLHWNGGRDKVEMLMDYCNMRGLESPEKNVRTWEIVLEISRNFWNKEEFFGKIGSISKLDYDNHDNGMYIIKDWKIVGRKYKHNKPERYENDPLRILLDIDARQPSCNRIGEDKIRKLYNDQFKKDWMVVPRDTSAMQKWFDEQCKNARFFRKK